LSKMGAGTGVMRPRGSGELATELAV
jgi:hypothetical protein